MESPRPLTRELARYAAGVRPDDVPEKVLHEAVRAFVNWVGVAIGGCQEEAVARASAVQVELGSKPQATVIGQSLRTDVASAAFLNCIASSVLAFDDAHLPSVAHPSGPAAAAVFALAQTRKVDGRTFLRALVLGIEVQCRMANMLTLSPSTFNPGFYVNGFSGPVGVALAAGHILGLDEEKMIWAIGLAASQASGLRGAQGTMAGHFRPGHASRSGVWAALLAYKGFDCRDNVIEARGGLLDVVAPNADPDFLLAGLGEEYEMLRNRYKPYPCGIVIHPVIDACLDLYQRIPSGTLIEKVGLKVNPTVVSLTGKRRPDTTLASHVSVYHWAAYTLLYGRAGLAATAPEALSDAAVLDLSDRVTAEENIRIPKEAAYVIVTLANGCVLDARIDNARGSGDRPMTDAEIGRKFDALVAGKLGQQASDRLRSACWQVGSCADVGEYIGPLLP